MHRAPIALAVLTLLGLPFLAPADAQGPAQPIFQYDMQVPQSQFWVGTGDYASTPGTLIDRTTWPTTVVPGSPAIDVQPTNVRLSVRPEADLPGWVADIAGPNFIQLYPGQTRTFGIGASAGANVADPVLRINLTAEFSAPDGSVFYRYASIAALTPGPSSFSVGGSSYAPLKPREVWDGAMVIRNRLLEPRLFEVKVEENPCNMDVGLQQQVTVDTTSAGEAFPFTVQAPDDSLWYFFGDPCSLTLAVAPKDNPDAAQRIFYNYTIQGPNLQFPFLFLTAVAILLLVLLVLFVRRRKEKVEEEILGKPQKPWTIPVEAVYLRHLKKRDERAWYVVRHYLMEDEYRSALLWYKAYRKATKGTLAREQEILAQERRYAKWKRRQEAAVAKPMLQADRYEAKLQRKLDRRARKEHRKARRKWRRDVRKIKAAAASQAGKQAERHAKAAKKAQKRGEPVPPAPVAAAPDLPPEPQPEGKPLAQHKWAKKAARHRARMARKQGDLEVRFEREDARMQARMERRLRKLAEDLDDPAFVAEHPGLGRPAGAPEPKGARDTR